MKKILPLAFATLLQGTSIGILIPILTHYVLSLGASDAVAPMIFSTFSLFAFVSSVFWGRLSDSIGRRKVLMISAVGSVLSYAWLAMATELWELFVSRAFAGIMAGWTVSAFAYVADCTQPENRGKGMGLVGAFFGMGFVIGPIIGVVISSGDNYAIAGWGAFCSGIVSILIALFLINEPEKRKDIEKLSLWNLFQNKDVKIVLLYAFFTSIIFTAVEGSYALYIYNKFSTSASEIGYILITAGMANIIMQGRGTYMIVKKVGEQRTLALAIVVKMLGLAMMMKIEVLGVYLPMAMIGVGMGLYFPSINALASKQAPTNLKGSMSGAIQGIQAFARIIAPAISG